MKNEFESMGASFAQGSVDCTYIQLTPNRKMVEHPPIDRLTWPRYQNAERWSSDPFVEAHMKRSGLPREIKTSGDGDTRSF